MRISDAARSLGMTSISICPPEDVHSPHVIYSDECVVLDGGITPIAPYLDVDGLTRACIDGKVDYVHPGEFLFFLFFSHRDRTDASSYFRRKRRKRTPMEYAYAHSHALAIILTMCAKTKMNIV